MYSSKVDQGSLDWALSQKDLTLSWRRGQTASGSQLLSKAPVEITFYWMRGDESLWDLTLPRNELQQLIHDLRSRGVNVPKAFEEALQSFSK